MKRLVEGTRTSACPLISVIVPVFNEAQVLPEFHRRLCAVLQSDDINSEILYVNDGSSDESVELITEFRKSDPRIGVINLSRNFGKEIAMTAGIDHADGEAVVIIDADLQDPPELIPELIQEWQKGYDVVYAKRLFRDGESTIKKASAHAFYRVIEKIGSVPIPVDTGDYRLLSRRAASAVRELRERHRFMKGLFAWIGYRQKAVLYRRDGRHAGHTKWNYWRLWNFALEGITSFSTAPLKVSTYLGILTAFGTFAYALFVILKTLLYGDPVKGYPSLMVMILFLGGIQLIALGVIGEYLARMFDETKQRPLYFVQHFQSPAITKSKRRKSNPREVSESPFDLGDKQRSRRVEAFEQTERWL